MSKSRSTSPTSNTLSTLNASSHSTTSRTPVQLGSPFELTLPEKESQSPPFTQVYPLPHSSPSIPPDSTDSQMTLGQLRLQQTTSRSIYEYSTSSYSKEGVASTSTGKRLSESSEPTGSSAKKKRTRTLTTPHQAAVLHSLLAKSRFPNASVREEVGRSIGLSARKVQVWFQNQRQKARRPQSQTYASHRLPHHFGTFPSGSGSFPLPPGPSSSHLASSSHSAEMGRSVACEYYNFDPAASWREPSFQLSGPGMPGLQSSSGLTNRGQRVIPCRQNTPYEGFIRLSDLRDQSMRSPSPVRLNLPPTVPNSASSSRPYEQDPSRTLPPLVFPPAPPRPSFSAPGSSSGPSRAPPDPHYRERRSLTPGGIFSYQPPESAAPFTWPHPSVVQPQNRRPTSSRESTYRSSRSPPPWALHERKTASRSVTPPVPVTEPPPSSGVTAAAAARPHERCRRYDPIRGTFIYSSPSEEH